MVVDSSAVIATLERESGWERLRQMLLGAEIAVMIAAVVVEVSTVIEAVALPRPEASIPRGSDRAARALPRYRQRKSEGCA